MALGLQRKVRQKHNMLGIPPLLINAPRLSEIFRTGQTFGYPPSSLALYLNSRERSLKECSTVGVGSPMSAYIEMLSQSPLQR